jgi:hypothetical protein
MDRLPMPATAPQEPASLALEIDTATSLALSRATSRAVCRLSAEAQRAVVRELEREAAVQETQGGPVGELVSALIKAFADELK